MKRRMDMVSLKSFQGCKALTFYSVKDRLKACAEIRKRETSPYHLTLKSQEKLSFAFPFSNFHLTREGRVYNDLSANRLDKEGKKLTTWKSRTRKVLGSHNVFEGLNIANTALNPLEKGQQVALAVYGDDNLFLRSSFSSTQDTLFIGPLPDDLITRYRGFLPEEERYKEGNCTNYFKDCKIIGSLDFIFGAGRALFTSCDIISIDDGREEDYVCAPSHSLKDDFGFFFSSCRFLNGGVKKSSVYLARPWREYGKCVFSSCTYQDHINPLLFIDWNREGREKTCRFEEYPLKDGRASFTRNKKGSLLPKRYEALLNEFLETNA